LNVIAYRFTQFIHIACIIESVVNELEGNAKIMSIGAQGLLLCRFCATQDRPYLACGADQSSGFARDDLEVILFRDF